MLGGCSSVNAMIYVRGNKADFDKWENATKSSEWGWNNVLHEFEELEDLSYLKSSKTGRNPVKLEAYQDTLPLKNTIFNGANELGYKKLSPLNVDSFIGFHSVPGTLDYGTRSSTAKAFLTPVKDKTNLFVVKHALVEKLLITPKKRVKQVKFFIRNTAFRVKAKKEIVLSAGTIGTPSILQRSGIGPKHLLESMGVKMVQNSPTKKFTRSFSRSDVL